MTGVRAKGMPVRQCRQCRPFARRVRFPGSPVESTIRTFALDQPPSGVITDGTKTAAAESSER